MIGSTIKFLDLAGPTATITLDNGDRAIFSVSKGLMTVNLVPVEPHVQSPEEKRRAGLNTRVVKILRSNFPRACSKHPSVPCLSNPDWICLNQDLVCDLGANTLDSMEFIMDVEKEFGVEIPDGQVERIFRGEQLVDYLMTLGVPDSVNADDTGEEHAG